MERILLHCFFGISQRILSNCERDYHWFHGMESTRLHSQLEPAFNSIPIIMGDKSPKSKKKNKDQKLSKSEAAEQEKESEILRKQKGHASDPPKKKN